MDARFRRRLLRRYREKFQPGTDVLVVCPHHRYEERLTLAKIAEQSDIQLVAADRPCPHNVAGAPILALALEQSIQCYACKASFSHVLVVYHANGRPVCVGFNIKLA